MVQLSITREREAQLGSDLKCLFRPNANLLSSSQGQRKSVPDLGSAEPEGALVPMARVI